jgi:D-sedoheptulose 7-phosphate isomerase
MNLTNLIKEQINASINTKLAVLEMLPDTIANSGQVLSNALQQGNKILCCGNGGSASDAQHFSAELLGRYVNERPSFPAIALNTDTSTLTAIGNDYGYTEVFARQIRALGQPGDVLVAISTSGNSANIIAAIDAARERGMQIIALTGKEGGKLAALLQPADVHVCVPDNTTSRIQEAHILVLHCWCEIIDHIYISNNPSMFKK